MSEVPPNTKFIAFFLIDYCIDSSAADCHLYHGKGATNFLGQQVTVNQKG